MDGNTDSITIDHGYGSTLVSTSGISYTDLAAGFGSVFLGHCHPLITAALSSQLQRPWHTSRRETEILRQATEITDQMLPDGHSLHSFYSTGMEAAEFAARAAATITGRDHFIGLGRSMHGKSALTASVCWENSAIKLPNSTTLPFPELSDTEHCLTALEEHLASGRIAAIFIEPVQGSNGCQEAEHGFYETVLALCTQYGSLCIFDEVLTGLYRTGPRFYMEQLRYRPDLMLFAKSIANGFPAAAVSVRDDVVVPPSALPGSTFSGNPLAAAAVVETLKVMQDTDMKGLVRGVSETIRTRLEPVDSIPAVLRGSGALWALDLDSPDRAQHAVARITQERILVSSHGSYIRLLPSANIALDTLASACDVIADACINACEVYPSQSE